MSNELKPSVPLCPQCGTYHPPVSEGEECPLKHKYNPDPDAPKPPDIGIFMTSMRSIILSNIEKKNINDIDKFQKHLIVELNKIIENYSE